MSVVLRSEVEREIRNMLEEGEAKSLLPGLAARLGPNSGCATWVVEAVKELEGERATLLRCVRVLLGDLDCLREALEDKNHAALLGYPRPDKEPKSWADQEHERLRKIVLGEPEYVGSIPERQDLPVEPKVTDPDRPFTSPLGRYLSPKPYLPLLRWRSDRTDAHGDDLENLLYSFIRAEQPDSRLADEPDLLLLWQDLRTKSDEALRWCIARYVRPDAMRCPDCGFPRRSATCRRGCL